MYCSSCGGAVAHNLIYCNHCGAKLSGAKGDGGKALELSPNILVCAMVFTFVFGMAAIIMFLSALKSPGFNEPIVIAALALSFLLLIGLESIFVWLLLSRRKDEKRASERNQLNEQTTKELYDAPARMLTEPIPSVTERTTNLLEPIHIEQKSKRI